MSQQTVALSQEAARRFLVRAHALDGLPSLPTVETALQQLEFVQEDSINICGRIHDLILWSRVRDYSPADLHRALYESPRQAFEYYFPNLSVLPLSDYSYFVRRMQRRAQTPGRWHGLESHEEAVAERLLQHMDTHGPLRTREAGKEDGHTTSGWGTRTTVAARVVEKLWLHGRLTVARRENFERWFDRTERLLPETSSALPDEAEEHAFLIRKMRRARRLFRLKKGDVETLGASAFVRVDIEGTRRPWYALAEDTNALHAASDTEPIAPTVHLLAPLDPLIYDRDRDREIFGFDYTWEVYTPAAKRHWGYYVLPVLFGDRLVGRLDAKQDRRTKTLHLVSLRLEPGIDEAEVGPALMTRLSEYARFLGAATVQWETVEPNALRERLSATFG